MDFLKETINNIFCWSKIREHAFWKHQNKNINEMFSMFFGAPLMDKEFRHDSASIVMLVRKVA